MEDLATNTQPEFRSFFLVFLLLFFVDSPEAQCADSLIDPHFLLEDAGHGTRVHGPRAVALKLAHAHAQRTLGPTAS